MKLLQKILVTLRIVQIVSNTERKAKGLPKLGGGYNEAYRFNPINPLSYLFLVFVYLVSLVMFGFSGTLEKNENPFKWN